MSDLRILYLASGEERVLLFDKKVPSVRPPQPTPSIILTEEVVDFINGALLGNGEIVNSVYTHEVYTRAPRDKNILSWFKDRFEEMGIETSLTEISGGWRIETKPYPELDTFRKAWYHAKRKIAPCFTITPITLFNWYIQKGSCYEYDGHRYMSFNGYQAFKAQETLRSLGTETRLYRGAQIKVLGETGIANFLTYICSHRYKIPEYLYRGFPPEYIAFNETWSLMEKLR
jgi:hypothetical protein